MWELFESCPKRQFFNFFGVFLALRPGGGDEFGQKRCKIVCSDVSGTTWKISCLSPDKITIFHINPYFSTCPSEKSGPPNHFKITFQKVQEENYHYTKCYLTPYLWFLGAFENYLFFITILTLISEKHHVIKQLPW